MITKLRIPFKNSLAYEFKYELHQANDAEYASLTEKDLDAIIQNTETIFDKFIKDDQIVWIEIDICEGTARVIPTEELKCNSHQP